MPQSPTLGGPGTAVVGGGSGRGAFASHDPVVAVHAAGVVVVDEVVLGVEKSGSDGAVNNVQDRLFPGQPCPWNFRRGADLEGRDDGVPVPYGVVTVTVPVTVKLSAGFACSR